MAARLCAECKKPLTKQRIAQRKRSCGRCEPIIRQRRKRSAHDRRVTMNGFTGADYWALYDAQNGHCAILNCKANGRTKFLAVEHDHSCGRGHDPRQWCRYCVRGLCCSMHNGWLGKAADDPRVFDCLAAYLRHPPARKILS